jgi:alpha/beta superfamily hydrolase
MISTTAPDQPKQRVLLPHADHFFAGQLEPMHFALAGWLTASLKEQLQ